MPAGQNLADDVRRIWANVARPANNGDDGEAGHRRRSRHIVRFYRELADLGHPITRVEQLDERHAVALLDHWRRSKKALSTIRGEWSLLRAWAAAIGKPEVVRPLTLYWKESIKRPPQPAPGHSARHQDITLLNALRAGSDATHYWVERACAVLHLTVAEAMTLDCQPILRFLEGRRNVDLKARLCAAIATRPHEAREVAQSILAFLQSVGREVLLWQSVDLAKAVTRHANHLAYQRRQLKKKQVVFRQAT
nr:phage integrase N-terminal domain-containing protein [Ramlibacter albus]